MAGSPFSGEMTLSGADTEFPVGGGANPPGGVPTYDFAKFCEKLHEIEKISGRRGGLVPGAPPLNPPLVIPSTVAKHRNGLQVGNA